VSGAHYLLSARRADGLPEDAIARLHLGEGAGLERFELGR
jgi:hypothetical protein